MKYRLDYQKTHDIDWFFRYNGKVYHAASNGGRLPDVVDSAANRRLQVILEETPGIHEIVLSRNIYQYYDNEEQFSSFAEYASKGLISLDRDDGGDDGDDDLYSQLRYHIVAYPKNDIHFSNEELLNLIPVLDDFDIIIR